MDTNGSSKLGKITGGNVEASTMAGSGCSVTLERRARRFFTARIRRLVAQSRRAKPAAREPS